MIANEREYKMTKKAAKKLQVAHEAANRLPSAAVDPRIHATMQDGILNQLDELHDQMSEYEDGIRQMSEDEDGIRVVVLPGWETSTGVIRSQQELHDQISEYEDGIRSQLESEADERQTLRVCYLAGPMRGIPFWNQSEFEHVARFLRKMGWLVFSPFEHDLDAGEVPPEDGSSSQVNLAGCLAWDFARIAEADCVVVLPGWETSTGVHWEMTVAYALEKRVLQYPTMTDIELPQVVTDPVAATQPDPDLSAEVRVTDPITGASKGSKLARFDLLPWDVLTELAEHYGRGSLKYDDRNWEKGYRWSLSSAALGRHLAAWLSGEDTDQETGSSHLVAVIWHAAALRWFQKHNRGTDDRSKAE